MLGINFDWKLKFSTRIEDIICKKGLHKFNLQERITRIQCTIKNSTMQRSA